MTMLPVDLVPAIYNMDCREGLAALPERSVSLVLTSPPYWRGRRYSCGPEELGWEPTWQDYVARLVEHLHGCQRVLAPDGNLLLNVRQAAWTGPLQAALQEDGWVYQQTYCWAKPNPVPCGRMEYRPVEAWEPVFWFTVGRHGHFDEDANRVPYAPRTIRHGRVSFGGSKHYTNGRTCSEPNPLGGHPRNLIEAPVGVGSRGHPAPFPVKVATRLIMAHSPAGSLVCDPFAGSGTTLRAARALGRRSIGFELSPVAYESARANLFTPVDLAAQPLTPNPVPPSPSLFSEMEEAR